MKTSSKQGTSIDNEQFILLFQCLIQKLNVRALALLFITSKLYQEVTFPFRAPCSCLHQLLQIQTVVYSNVYMWKEIDSNNSFLRVLSSMSCLSGGPSNPHDFGQLLLLVLT